MAFEYQQNEEKRPLRTGRHRQHQPVQPAPDAQLHDPSLQRALLPLLQRQRVPQTRREMQKIPRRRRGRGHRRQNSNVTRHRHLGTHS